MPPSKNLHLLILHQNPNQPFYLEPLPPGFTLEILPLFFPVDPKQLLKILNLPSEMVRFLLPSGQQFDRCYSEILKKFGDKCENLQNQIFQNKWSREFFTPSNLPLSFWLTPLWEKNNFKIPELITLAQVAFCQHFLEPLPDKYRSITLHSSDKNFLTPFKNWKGVSCKIKILSQKIGFSLPASLKKIFPWMGGIFNWLKFFSARFWAGPVPNEAFSGVSSLFFTYFPSLNLEKLKLGEFENNYTPELQKLLEKNPKTHGWIAIFTPLGGTSFSKALEIQKQLANHPSPLFFWEQFLNWEDFPKALGGWLSLWLNKKSLQTFLPKCPSLDPNEKATHQTLKTLWNRGFHGYSTLFGFTYFLAFQNLARKFSKEGKKIFFLYENQEWEIALNLAFKEVNPTIKRIGFQHTSVSKKFSHYFPSLINGTSINPPLPTDLVLNGDLLRKELQPHYPFPLRVAEAFRQFPLLKGQSFVAKKLEKGDTLKLLVAGSIQKEETQKILQLVGGIPESFKNLQILLKGHPALPIAPLWNAIKDQNDDRSGVDSRVLEFDGSLYQAMEQCHAIIVPSSTAGIEALHFGLEVLIPFFPDRPTLNPLADFPGFFHPIESSNELAAVLVKLKEGTLGGNRQRNKEFVQKYWKLDPSMEEWKKIIAE